MSSPRLALCASERQFSVALSQEGTVYWERPDGKTNAGELAAQVQTLCARHGVAPTSIEEVRVDVGPGSYTGLRVAVTFARVLATFGNAAIRTTTSLELMALAAWRAGSLAPDALVRPVLDARRDRFHHGALRLERTGDREQVQTVQAPAATELAALESTIQAGDVLLADENVTGLLGEVPAAQQATVVTPHPFDARLMFDPAVRVVSTPPEELEPLYLMGSYAET